MNREIGYKARAWKGESAGYVAKHLWIIKHYGKAHICENPDCKSVKPKRFEWANISKQYHRERTDYKMLCPSCHRKEDHGNHCRRGHEYTPSNTRFTAEGWRICKQCNRESQIRYKNKKYGKQDNKIQSVERIY